MALHLTPVWIGALVSVLCFTYADGVTEDIVIRNFTNTPGCLLSSFTAGSLLQCTHQCGGCRVAVEWQTETSTCVVLRSASEITGWNQYRISSNWTYNAGSCYLKTKISADWATCVDICTEYGGHLTAATTVEEATFLQQFGTAWLGGVTIDGAWTWVNGEVFDYTHWLPGQPNGAETCTGNKVNGWNDFFCVEQWPCLCEV